MTLYHYQQRLLPLQMNGTPPHIDDFVSLPATTSPSADEWNRTRIYLR
ncbi:hypothetical protein BDA96_06G015900 [Sorghum bicolor]|uniref:Uncharacterized protein n=2 Tax=Sorghum bicolor TaxID=4558 RepID=A0A921UAZ5_SORBI|nr:hypothetical protein BDA96_06G015900 [Sorghum bicolor]KXG25804.2 hypothetical protein SORBI_3006G014566 [Sorghum bicolor]